MRRRPRRHRTHWRLRSNGWLTLKQTRQNPHYAKPRWLQLTISRTILAATTITTAVVLSLPRILTLPARGYRATTPTVTLPATVTLAAAITLTTTVALAAAYLLRGFIHP
ncbi:hypothetical protein GOEFS_035_00520 [Gordonia effusa NBRC 100432]|uniref:Uncharacterized protein n=1 Tax=Gordonia effusa NBRC 100432 TaxID=1077974 RepID=H0QXG9_9ACTN|nr:hypothetical protein GOEFS_035_00520 [Gordonia effusa NBRC 100432]